MNLRVVTHGQGPDLVLLHGWSTCGDIWQSVAAELSRYFRVYCIDLPGYGASAICKPYTFDRIIELLDAMLPTTAIVCGWSLGAQLALQWAAVMPQRVSRLILIAATPCFVRRADWQHGMEISMLDNFMYELHTNYQTALRRFIALQTHGDVAARSITRELQHQLKIASPRPATLTAGLQLLRTTDLRKRLATIKQPALVLHGDRDVITPPSAGTWLAQALPSGRLSVLSGTAHAPFLSQPRLFAKQVLEFCGER